MKEFFSSLSLDALFQSLSIFVAVATFIIANAISRARDRQVARRDIYLQLELASIDLFRFEANNIDLIRSVWEDKSLIPAKGKAEYIVTMNYICQMLNLFELAIKFRKNKTMPPDIFGSWIAWYYLLLNSPGFPFFWSEVRWDYIPELRKILDGGQRIIKEYDDEDIQRARFYQYVGEVIKCPVITDWTAEDEDTPLDAGAGPGKNTTGASGIEMSWVRDSKMVEELVLFFEQNTDEKYISHGEIQDGRATGIGEWSPHLKEVLGKEFSEAVHTQQGLQNENLAIATLNGEIAGLMLILVDYKAAPAYATLSDIVIRKEKRGMGVGQAMIKWMDEEMVNNDILQVYAESGYINKPAHDFLHRNDFKTVSIVLRKELIAESKSEMY